MAVCYPEQLQCPKKLSKIKLKIIKFREKQNPFEDNNNTVQIIGPISKNKHKNL